MGRQEDVTFNKDTRGQSEFVPGGSSIDYGDAVGLSPLERFRRDAEYKAGVALSRRAMAEVLEGQAVDAPTDTDEASASATVAAKPGETTRKRNKVAFGGFVKEWQYDPEADYDLEAVTEVQRNWLTPEKIAGFLFTPGQDKRPEGVVYNVSIDNRRQRSLEIGLNPYEYGLLPRHPERLADAVRARTQAANEVTEEGLDKRERSVGHVFEAKLPQLSEHAGKLLDAQAKIRELNAEAHKPGYAHKSSEAMTELLANAWREFTTMLDVVHTARNWSDAERKQAEAALLHRLTRGGQREKVGNWWEMLELADNYLTQRIAVFRNRINETRGLIPAKESELETA